MIVSTTHRNPTRRHVKTVRGFHQNHGHHQGPKNRTAVRRTQVPQQLALQQVPHNSMALAVYLEAEAIVSPQIRQAQDSQSTNPPHLRLHHELADGLQDPLQRTEVVPWALVGALESPLDALNVAATAR